MTRTLVIGYGNPVRGDDGLGWSAAEQLARTAGADVDVLARHQLTPELAADVSRVSRLILVDATRETGGERVAVRRVKPEGSTLATSSHELMPGELLACALQLFGSAPETWLVTVRGDTFDYSDRLSPAVKEAIPLVVQRVQEIIALPEHGPEP